MDLVVAKFPSGWWGVQIKGVYYVTACKSEHEAYLQAKMIMPFVTGCTGIVNERGERYV